jgi:steroid delta-isomerase-like uncharacterized protein
MESNLEQHKKAHEAFNRRDFDAILDRLADGFVYHDRARSIEFRGRDEFRMFLSEWARSFSDARIDGPTYVDAGDRTIAQFTGRGTNDGPFGQLAPTGKTMTMDMCELMQFDAEGRIVGGDIYYDQLTLLVQLGHAQPRPSEAAAAPPPQP